MSRIAIVGSCITRDLWPVRGEALSDVLYLSRTSLPSLFAPAVSGFRPAARPPGGLRQHQHRALVADLRKTALARLVAFRPTHVIFDFIDERFDLLSVGPALATHSWELEASGYLRQRAFKAARPIPRLSAGAERLWREAAGEFAALVRATPLREARLILHSARWAEESRGPRGRLRPIRDVEVLPGRPGSIADHNALLGRYQAWFAEVMPPLDYVAAPEHRLADEGHQWGLSPFHYVPGYYDAIWRQLAELDVARPLSAPLAAPVFQRRDALPDQFGRRRQVGGGGEARPGLADRPGAALQIVDQRVVAGLQAAPRAPPHSAAGRTTGSGCGLRTPRR